MTITKLKPVGHWGALTNDLTHVGATLGGRRVITGMLTGSDGLLARSAQAVGQAPAPQGSQK
jgi:hypothetical protein